jgi:hypothetical protein
LTKASKTYVGEKTASSTNGAWKTRCLHVENWKAIPISHSVQKLIQMDQMDQRFKCNASNFEMIRGKHRDDP